MLTNEGSPQNKTHSPMTKPTTTTKKPTPSYTTRHTPSRLPVSKRRLLITRYNRSIDKYTSSDLKKTLHTLTISFPLAYPNLNIIVLGGLHYTFNNNLHRIGNDLSLPLHNLLTLLIHTPVTTIHHSNKSLKKSTTTSTTTLETEKLGRAISLPLFKCSTVAKNMTSITQ